MGEGVGGARVPSNGVDMTASSTADRVLFALSSKTSEADDSGRLSDGALERWEENWRLIGFTAGGGIEMLGLSSLPLEVTSASAVRPFLLLAEDADERLWEPLARNWAPLAALSLEEVRSRASMRRPVRELRTVRSLRNGRLGGLSEVGIFAARNGSVGV
jgi:hypothetical protein